MGILLETGVNLPRYSYSKTESIELLKFLTNLSHMDSHALFAYISREDGTEDSNLSSSWSWAPELNHRL